MCYITECYFESDKKLLHFRALLLKYQHVCFIAKSYFWSYPKMCYISSNTFKVMKTKLHRSLKSLNRSSLLRKPSFWERWGSIRKRAKSNEWTDIIQILSSLLKSDIRTKERSKNGWKTLWKNYTFYIF